jgi:hypothetical protein
VYDDWREPYLSPHDEIPDLAGRLTHLVYVGGRLVDTWHERAAETRWASYVERPAAPPAPPPPAPHVRVLDWLADVCGGAAAVAALHTEPLSDEPVPVPAPGAAAEERLSATADLTDLVADRWFDDETALAFRAALRLLWVEEPATVERATTPAHLAAGICWAVGKANGLFAPVGACRVGAIHGTLALPGTPSAKGNEVAGALRGFRGFRIDRWGRPHGVPDLLVLGRPELLVSTTREQLVRLRGKAQAAAA